VFTTSFQPVLPSAGETFHAPEHKSWKALEDLGYVKEIGVERTQVSRLEGDNRRIYLQFMKGTLKDHYLLYSYHCVHDIPERFHFMYVPEPRVFYQSMLEGI
jgi:hypothetical protein